MGLLSLIGGLIGANSEKKDRAYQTWLNTPAGIRQTAEEAGFNPLIFAGARTMGAGYSPQFGNTIANALAAADDQLNARAQLQLQKQELEMENQRLTQQMQRQTLRPTVPGIYEQRRAAGIPEGTPVTVAGIGIEPSPAMSDADTAETRWGDLASWVYGLGTMAADFQHNAGPSAAARWWNPESARRIDETSFADAATEDLARLTEWFGNRRSRRWRLPPIAERPPMPMPQSGIRSDRTY